MFRGFRWQLIALIVALAIFAAGAAFRISRQSNITPALQPTPTAQVQATAIPSPNKTTIPDTDNADTDQLDSQSQAGMTTYREAMIGSVQRLNPLFAHLNPPDQDISGLIFEGLFAINEYGETVPQLAAEVVISGDGLEYVIRLRDDIRWQDNIALSADDVLYTMSLLSEPGYADFSPAAAFWQTVETQRLGSDLLRFRLAQPFASFPYLLTIGILPEHALRGIGLRQLVGHPFNLSPIGTGAYQLAFFHASDSGVISEVRLALSPIFQNRPEAANAYYFNDLRFSFYNGADAAIAAYFAGEIDGLANIAPRTQLISLPESQVYTQVDSMLHLLIFNWNDPRFTEKRLRQALALSLDVPALVEAHLGSNATYADSPYAPGSSIYQPHEFWVNHDLEQARSMLETDLATEPEEATGETESDSAEEPGAASKISLLVEDTIISSGLGRDIAAQWELLGFEIELDIVTREQLANRLQTGSFEAAIVAQRINSDPDLYRFWHPAQSVNGANYGAVSQQEIAELLEGARGEIYGVPRAMLYQQFQSVFAEEAIAIPLYYPLYTFVARDSIAGIELGHMGTAADRFRGIGKWRPVELTS